MLAAKKRTILHFGPKKKEQPEGAGNSPGPVGLPQQEAMTSTDSGAVTKQPEAAAAKAAQKSGDASPDDIEAGAPESGEGKAAAGCAYTVYFARTDPRARLFCETETITCEGWCSFQGTDEAEHRPTFAT